MNVVILAKISFEIDVTVVMRSVRKRCISLSHIVYIFPKMIYCYTTFVYLFIASIIS